MLNPESPSTAPALIDPASKAFQSLLDKLAPTEATVLIVGETGTGKEVVARYLHHHSARRQRPPFRGFKPAGLSLLRAGEGAFLMAEQFSFGEALGQRAAVNGQKRLLATGAVMMEITAAR